MEASKVLVLADSLDAMSVPEVKALAKHMGVPISGQKADIIVRLMVSQVTAHDLQVS